jgi:glucosamine--fructose-6-phosphate aminotransferase (isomerizing)
VNAHPHLSQSGRIAVVHNGVIENFAALRESLVRKGYTPVSQTDTELFAHLIEDVRMKEKVPLDEAVRLALTQVQGAFGIAVISLDDPDLLIAARRGSPLMMGVRDANSPAGTAAYLIASDASAVVEYTRRVIYLEDSEMCVIRPSGYEIMTLDNVQLTRSVEQLELSLAQIQKGDFKHFMLKEIMEQPEALRNTMRGRITVGGGRPEIKFGGLEPLMGRLSSARRLVFCACGTSWHAALVGEYLIEQLAGINVEVEYASEFRYRNPILANREGEEDVVFVISQSGETADTLAAAQFARKKGILAIGICNVVGSSIARETDAGIYLHAGPEIGVASTKAFTAQITCLVMLALKLGLHRGAISAEQFALHTTELLELPEKMEQIFAQTDKIIEMARVYRYAHNFLYLGRGYNFPVALEGALKLKEISYIHAGGCAHCQAHGARERVRGHVTRPCHSFAHQARRAPRRPLSRTGTRPPR